MPLLRASPEYLVGKNNMSVFRRWLLCHNLNRILSVNRIIPWYSCWTSHDFYLRHKSSRFSQLGFVNSKAPRNRVFRRILVAKCLTTMLKCISLTTYREKPKLVLWRASTSVGQSICSLFRTEYLCSSLEPGSRKGLLDSQLSLKLSMTYAAQHLP